MCGIVGIVSPNKVENKDWLVKAMDTLFHRGPDAAGIWWSSEENIGFGHRRLSIIDLSSDANQPMFNQSKDLCIVFNGEIYNYIDVQIELSANGAVFNSKSDTEVILAAYKQWGVDCLSHFNGIFSFAIYDMYLNHIFIARDRAGEKPFFYTQLNNQFRFASEIKALIHDPSFERIIDNEALDIFLTEGYIPGEKCILKGINKLSSGHAMIYNTANGDIKKWRYWKIPEYNSESKVDEKCPDNLVDELEFLLTDAVNRQLVADVPVGILLSGGVDSSIITALAAQSNSNLRTFTVGFPGHPRYDESNYARLIANHFGTNHVQLEAAPISFDVLIKLAKQFDEPIIDSSMIPTFLVSQMIRTHCTVALGGDGGDELFGGYSHYEKLLRLQQNSIFIPNSIKKLIAHFSETILPVGTNGRNWIRAIGCDLKTQLPLIACYFDIYSRSKLMNSTEFLGSAELSWKERIQKGCDIIQRATRTDFENYLPEDILVKVDRASMLNSLEIRAPMLDYRVIEFAFKKIPSSLKVQRGQKKILLKKLASKILPPQFDLQRKQGFSIPLSSWLSSEIWSRFFKEILLDNDQVIFNHNYIQDLFDGQAKGRNNGERIFGLVMFELWRKEYNIKN
jgi:asparagine synthase (glutamine-hydrolysing)